jgi:Domain of unknown function (DUF4824)
MSWRSFIIALILPLWVTGATLASVSRNRSGGREAIVLTEREVFVSPRTDDNTAAKLFLSWQQPPSIERATWFNAEKLAQLGFDTRIEGSELQNRRQLPREIFVVLELDGPAWRAFLEDRLRGLSPPRGERTIVDELAEKGSRLVPVDADRDASVLKAKYPDARRHLIAAATARPQVVSPPNESPYVVGTINRIMPQQIHIPREWAAQVPTYHPSAGRAGARFDVDVRYGLNYEPWVTAIRRR